MGGVRLARRALPLAAQVLMALAFVSAVACGQDPIYNGHFEVGSPESPPPGWTMWGPERYKDPANYTRDTADPHGGSACFRIHHPADTSGYIVSSPQRPILAERNTKYIVSFWARTKGPGASRFGFTAYETIAPYVDAPSPGWFTFEAEQEWKQFRFEASEGIDFYAGRSRLLLLSFKATTDDGEENTLWIDDVVVSTEMIPEEERLIDKTELECEPLQHRLSPGDRLEFTVDAERRLRPAARNVGGVSFHCVAGWTGQPYDRQGNYTLDPKLEEAMREMRLPMTRFYAVGEEPFGLEASIDKAAELCRRIGVPLDRVPLELEAVNASTKLDPDLWARAVRYARRQGYGFRRWEVGNEVYATIWGVSTAFPTSEDYIEHLRAVSEAVREVDPQAQVGVSIHPHETRWGNYVLKRAAGSYDFVVPHFYTGFSDYGAPFERVALTLNYRVLEDALRLNALIRACNPDRDVYQYDTEWGLHTFGPNEERADNVDRNANIFGTIHRAVRLIYYAREGMLRGASSWQMLNRVGAQGFGILAQEAPDKRFMLYWLYYYFNRHVGEWVLATDGTAPWHEPGGEENGGAGSGPLTPVLATLSEDGRSLYLVIANGSWERTVPCRVSLRSFAATGVRGILLSHPDPDGKPLLERKEDAVSELPVELSGDVLTCTIPPHSAVFISLVR